MPIDVFISYAHASAKTAARKLRDKLVESNLEVFFDDREIPYGNPFPREIADGLLESRLTVVFADETYFQRPWCLYEYQVATAPYRAAVEAEDLLLEHIVVIFPESVDVTNIVAHLPPPLARTSWPTAGQLPKIAALIDHRLQGLQATLASRLSGVNDDAVERLRAGGDIPLSWAAPQTARTDESSGAKSTFLRCLDLAPESRGEEFIGRGAELWRVFHHLVSCRAFRTPRACAVQGLGGSGKSQLAAEFVARYSHRFFPGGTIWISAEGDALTLAGQFRSIFQRVSPDSPDPATGEDDPERQRDLLAVALAQYFSTANSGADVLWVVDGIPEPSGEKPRKISYWCPVQGHVSLLTTSRRTGLPHMDGYVEVGSLTAASAVELLTRPAVDRRWLKEEEWKDLADWVGGLPLAISILRASLSDGFTTAEALKVARRKEPSLLLDREMDALRGEVEDERLRGITEAFDFSYRALEKNADLRHSAHLAARLAPYALPEKIFSDLVPPALIGRLAKRSWIQAVTSAGNGQAERRWIMHRVPASFLRARTENVDREHADLFNWLHRQVSSDLNRNDTNGLQYHLMVVGRGFSAHLPELDPDTSQALPAARAFAVTAVSHSILEPEPDRKGAGLRFLAAELANQTGAGDEIAACLEDALQEGDPDTAAAIPHTLQALAGSPRAVSLMSRLLQDSREPVRYQAIVHAPGLRALELAFPLLDALLIEADHNLTAGYDIYLDNRCQALRDILSQLANALNTGTPLQRERAVQLLGRALIVNGPNLAAGGYTSDHIVSSLLHVALKEGATNIGQAAVSSASHFFDAGAYNILLAELNQEQDSEGRARALSVMGAYLSETRRPPPPAMSVKMLDSGGMRISGQLGKTEPMPPDVYDPLIEAAESWFFRSISRSAAGDTEQALEDIRQALSLDPSDERFTQFKAQLESYLGGKG